MRRGIRDFVCAFLIFAMVLSGIAAVAGESFSRDAVKFDRDRGFAEIFGIRLESDRAALDKAEMLLSFNDNIFSGGFSATLKKTAEFAFCYIGDLLKISYSAAQRLVGAG